MQDAKCKNSTDSLALPLILNRGDADTKDLAAWGAHNRLTVLHLLSRHGAILFRDFEVSRPEQFRAAFCNLVGDPLNYIERSSPRTQIAGRIYTSTEYPPERAIFLHNEQSYNVNFPRYIAFFCQAPAHSGGATPLADTRRVLHNIDPELRRELHRTGYCYVRNFGGRLRMTWQHAFDVTHASALETYCRENAIDFEWLGVRGGPGLRTRQTRFVIAQHPVTHELAWFNHLAFFHSSSADADIRQLLSEVCGADLPHATCSPDQVPFKDEWIRDIRSAYTGQEQTFEWQAGDVLLVDNILVAHGRRPFTGPRTVLVAMGGRCNWADVEFPQGEQSAEGTARTDPGRG